MRVLTSAQVAGIRLFHNDGLRDKELMQLLNLRQHQINTALYFKNCHQSVEVMTWAGGPVWRNDQRLRELHDIYQSIERCRPKQTIRLRGWRLLQGRLPRAVIFGKNQETIHAS